MAQEQPKRPTPMIPPNRVQMAENGRNIWLITAETGAFPEDFLQPEFYANVSKDFRPMDHVEVRTDDGLFWGEYLVVAADRQWAKVHALRSVQLQAAEEQPADTRYRVAYKGPHLKWCVIRESDKSAIHEGSQERKHAINWLEDYIRTIGKKAA